MLGNDIPFWQLCWLLKKVGITNGEHLLINSLHNYTDREMPFKQLFKIIGNGILYQVVESLTDGSKIDIAGDYQKIEFKVKGSFLLL